MHYNFIQPKKCLNMPREYLLHYHSMYPPIVNKVAVTTEYKITNLQYLSRWHLHRLLITVWQHFLVHTKQQDEEASTKTKNVKRAIYISFFNLSTNLKKMIFVVLDHTLSPWFTSSPELRSIFTAFEFPLIDSLCSLLLDA